MNKETKKLKNELDKLWREAVRLRDKKCIICQKQDGLDAHHIFSRNRMNTRWDLDNGILLCSSHHTLNSSFSAHKTPRSFFRWLEEKRGEKFVDDLEVRSQMIAKGIDYKIIKIYLEQSKMGRCR